MTTNTIKNMKQLKTFSLKFKMEKRANGNLKGFQLKRELTVRECRHVMKNILDIVINELEDCDGKEDYIEYNEELASTVNEWLTGEIDDSVIMEYASDCSDEPLGCWNAFAIAEYLSKRDII